MSTPARRHEAGEIPRPDGRLIPPTRLHTKNPLTPRLPSSASGDPLGRTRVPRPRPQLGRAAAPPPDPSEQPPRSELLAMDPDMIQRHSQLAHHGHDHPPGIVLIARLLGLVPGSYPALLDQPQRREIEPLPRPCTAPLANPQLSLVAAAAPLHQIQSHRLAVGGGRVILPWVTRAGPQDTRRRHTHHLPLGLEDRVSHGQA